jgi:hypothetical protein
VAEAVVHHLEAVEVEEHDGNVAPGARAAGQGQAQPVVQQHPVGQPGEVVVQGLVGQRPLRPLAVRGVAGHHLRGATAAEGHRHGHRLHVDDAAVDAHHADLAEAGLFTRPHGGHAGLEHRVVLGVDEVEGRPPQELVR